MSEQVQNTALDLAELQEQVRVRYEKLGRLRASEKVPFKNGYEPKDLASDLHRAYDEKTKEQLEPLAVKASIAGRIMAIRDFGKDRKSVV